MGFWDRFLLDRALADLFNLTGSDRDLFFALENRHADPAEPEKKSAAPQSPAPSNPPAGTYKYQMYDPPSQEELLWKQFERTRAEFDERKEHPVENDTRTVREKAIDKLIASGSTNRYVLQEIELRKQAEEARRAAKRRETDLARMEAAHKENEAIQSMSDEAYWKEIRKRVAEKTERKDT